MSDSRFFLLNNDAVKDAIFQQIEKQAASRRLAMAFASSNKLGEPVFHRYSLFDARLYGFHSKGSDVDFEFWVKPKRGVIWPRAKKGSEIHKAFCELSKKCSVTEDALIGVMGWRPFDFFPTKPGYQINIEKRLVVFVMGGKTDSLPHCHEISNIELRNMI